MLLELVVGAKLGFLEQSSKAGCSSAWLLVEQVLYPIFPLSSSHPYYGKQQIAWDLLMPCCSTDQISQVTASATSSRYCWEITQAGPPNKSRGLLAF